MSRWLSPSELAAMKLPGLPGTRAIQIKAKAENWPRQRGGQGGGWKYPVTALPPEAQEALRKRAVAVRSTERTVQASTAMAAIDPARLKTYQRDTMQARAVILAEIDTLVAHGHTPSKAIDTLVAMARAGELPPDLAKLVPVANARAGAGRTVTRATLYNWLKARERADGTPLALAPAAPAEAPVPDWAGPLMERYARPTKPSLAWAVDDLASAMGAAAPSYDQARRFLLKLDTITRNRGRMGPRALKALRAYVARDTAELWPGAVYVSDGHCFDAEVQHPRHGRPFRPEMVVVVDVYTRRIVGWSLGLAENAWDVTAAATKAFTTATVCDIWYADNGPGYKNRMWDDHLTGLAARLSITKKHSLPYNSQARGVVERLHQTLWVSGAKRLPAYMGAAMDGEARQKAFKVSRRDIKRTGKSRLLMEWPDFVRFAADLVAAYNGTHQHSGLSRIHDPETGKRRHMTPDEMWADAVAKGWTPDIVPEAEAADLFRPYEKRTTHRALVELFGNTYFAKELEAYHGEDVLVGYDTTDARRVWVRAMDGRFIAIAAFEGHKTSFFPVPVAEQARERRMLGRLARNDAHRAEILAELNPGTLLDHRPAVPFAASDALAEAAELIDAMEAPAALQATGPEGRPLFSDDVAWVRWLIANPERVTAGDAEGLRTLMRSPSFRLELELNGVAATALNDLVNTKTKAS